MTQLTATVPRNRLLYGTLDVGGQSQFRCLARSDAIAAAQAGNPKRDPLKRDGDLPYGEYNCTLGAVETPLRSYGPHPVIHLSPTGGDALVAAKNGRRGFLLHSGALADDGVSLRPTHGCLRVADNDQSLLIALIDWSQPVNLSVIPLDEDGALAA